MILISILIPFFIALWVAMDAKKRGYDQFKVFLWFLGVWLILIVFLPLYFILRSRIPPSKKGTSRETHVCPYCGRLYKGNFSVCPYCGSKLATITTIVYTRDFSGGHSIIIGIPT